MRPGPWRRFVVRPLVWFVVLVAIGVLGLRVFLSSGLARERARQMISARLSEALARRVELGGVDFELLPLRLVVYDLVVAGDARSKRPFLHLAKGEIEADLGSWRAPHLELRHVALDGLQIDLEFRADGSNNLPKLRGGGGTGGFVVRIDELSVDRGEVHVGEETAPFALDAEAVLARFVGLEGGILDGRVVAQQVRLALPEARPTVVAVAGRVRIGNSKIEILRARLSAPDLSASAQGTIALNRPVQIALTTQVDTSSAWLDRVGWLHGEIGGRAHFTGTVGWKPGAFHFAGEATSPRLDIVGFELTDLNSRVTGDAKRITAEIDSARWADGAVNGRFAVGIAKHFPAELDLNVDGAAIDPVLARFGVPVRHLRGRLFGPFVYRFDLDRAERGVGHGELTITAPAAAGGPAANGHVRVTLADGTVVLPDFSWSASGQSVEGTGSYELPTRRGRFDLRVASEDVGRLTGLLPFLEPGQIWLPTAGTAELGVGVDLDGERVRAEVDLAGAALVAPGIRAARARGHLVATLDRLEITRLDLERNNAELQLSGIVPLTSGAGAPALALELVATRWPVGDAKPWLPFDLPLAGPMSGTLRLAGSLDALRGSLAGSIMPVEVEGLAGQRLDAKLSWDDDRLRVDAAHLQLEAGGVEASGTLRFADEGLDFRLESPGLALGRAPLASLGGESLAGTLGLSARVGGTLQKPRLELSGGSTDATLFGEKLAPERQPHLEATWLDGELATNLELPGVLELRGGGRLEVNHAAQLHFTLASPSLGTLASLAARSPLEGLDGSLAARLDLDWPQGASPRARLEVPSAEFRWHDVQFRTREPIVVRLENGEIQIDSVYLATDSDDDEIFLGGRVRLVDDPELALHLQADLGAARLGPWLGDLDLGGRLTLLANLGGTASHPALNGEGQWSDGHWIPPVVPHSLEHASALVLFYPNAVVLDHLAGNFAGGTIAASGRVDLAAGGVGSYHLEAAARRFTLRWPLGWQLRGDADLTLLSTPAGRQLVGQAQLDRVYYVQDIDLSPAQLLQRLLARSRVVVPETNEFLASTALNVALRAPHSVRVRNNVADLTASADLAVRGTLAQPVLFGEVRADPSGKVIYAGNTYQLDRGVLTFANPSRIDPFMDIVVRTRVDQYDVTVDVAGPLSRPLTTFASDPPLPDLEILGLLTTGAAVDSSTFGTLTSSQLGSQSSVGAEALLYGQAASLVGARVGKLFGFDQVRVEPLTTGDTVSAARVTVGKRLSRKVFVTYSYDPSSTAQQILQVEWRLSDQLVLVMTQNGNESYSVDARWESRF